MSDNDNSSSQTESVRIAQKVLLIHNNVFKGVAMSIEEYKNKLKEIFEPCLSRADLKEEIEVVSLEWLLEMSNPHPSENTDLGSDKPGAIVSMVELSKDIKKRGLKEPLVIAVGLTTGRARLEAGNHRVRILLEMGLLHAPAVCWVGSSHIGFEDNGRHAGREVKFWPQARPLVALGPYDERYFEKPSAVLPSAPIFSMDEIAKPVRTRSSSASVSEKKTTEKKTRTRNVNPEIILPISGSDLTF